MWIPRLDFLSLRTRINLGFILICVLLSVVGITSYFTFLRIENKFLVFTNLSNSAELQVEIGRNVQQFTYEGHEATENRVYSPFEILNEDLNIALNLVFDNEAENIINKMIEHLNIYSNTFNDVVIERKLRNDLVQKELRNSAKNTEFLLTEYIQLEQKENKDHLFMANLILNELLRIEKKCISLF